MPPFQVIDRQVDPSAQLAIQTSNSIAQNIRQKQASALALMELKQKAKESDNEIEKARFERKAKILDYAFKLKDQGVEGPMLIKAVHDFGGEDTFPTLAEGGQRVDELLKTLGDAKGNGEREGRLALARKNSAEASTAEMVNARLANMQGDAQGGNFPPGTTVNAGGLSMPLNPRLTDTEQATVGGAENVDKYTTEFFNNFTKAPSLSEAQKIAIDSNEPYIAGKGNLGDIQSTKQSLMAIIPFAKGGKQLTEGEKKAFSDLLRLSGKSNARITRDYNTFRTEFKRSRELALGGSNAARSDALGPVPQKNYVRTGIDSATGKKVGQLADGTVEEIQ